MTTGFDFHNPQAIGLGEEISFRLDEARHAAGLTMEELASSVGVTWEEVEKVEDAVVVLCALAEALDVPPRELVPKAWRGPPLRATDGSQGAKVLRLPQRSHVVNNPDLATPEARRALAARLMQLMQVLDRPQRRSRPFSSWAASPHDAELAGPVPADEEANPQAVVRTLPTSPPTTPDHLDS